MTQIIEYPDLPVSQRRTDIIAALKANSVVILPAKPDPARPPRFPRCVWRRAGVPRGSSDAHSRGGLRR